jgi:cytochrome c-type biogenesis protein CcmE
MKKIIYLFALLIISGACTNSQKSNEEQVLTATNLDEIPVLTVESLLAHPDDYDGKQVKITGMVTHVCKHSGKRLHLMGSDEKTKVRLEAGEIGQFDRSLEGSDIIATGVFRRELIDEAYLAKWSDELGKGKNHDHDSKEEREENIGKMNRYRSMMKESEKGYLENFWVDGLSFETVQEEPDKPI